jgi:hypothetical protein
VIEKLVGIFLMLLSIVAAFYAGVIWALVGGIELIVHGVAAHPVIGSDIAWGIVRAGGLWEVICIVAFIVIFAPGAALAWPSKKMPTRRYQVNLKPRGRTHV